jgi:hypothetical protein
MVWDVTGDGRDVVRRRWTLSGASAVLLAAQPVAERRSRIADITLTGAAIPVPDYTSYRNDPSAGRTPERCSESAPYVNLVGSDFKTPSV